MVIILLMNDNNEIEPQSPLLYPVLQKAGSQRINSKDERVLQLAARKKQFPQVISYVWMRDRLNNLQKNVNKLGEPITPQPKKRQHQQPSLIDFKMIHMSERSFQPEICKKRISYLQPKPSMPDQSLSINTVTEGQYVRRSSILKQQQSLVRKSLNRRKQIQSMPKSKMSNNVKDYLSVERVSIREMEDSLIANKSKVLKQYRLSNLLAFQEGAQQKVAKYNSVDIRSQVEGKTRKIVKFKPPFQTYYYRDFMWKVGFSNGIIVEPVQQYEGKLKVYVGPGNNSNLIKGLIRRRPWWTLTDKPQQASFVWTQIKMGTVFGSQKKGSRLPVLSDEESPLLKGTKPKTSSKCPLFNSLQQARWQKYWQSNTDRQCKMKQSMISRSKHFNLALSPMGKVRSEFKIHNHFINNFIIGNKKALFATMAEYYTKLGRDVFNYLPLTFHIKKGLDDDEYLHFLQSYYAISRAIKQNPNHINKHNAWIVKPGQNTNQGNGIIVCLELNEIKGILRRQQKHGDGTLKTYILQKYIERPLLYKRRKFDLRHYMMLNCSNGRMKGYWYHEGYVRTTSAEYTLKQSTGGVHLTNDSVQKYLPDYGKYQKANKISYQELNQYLKKQNRSYDFYEKTYPRMKAIAADVIHASALNIDPQKRTNNFQIFGLDFMIDAQYEVWLIEVNTNPCLETACPLLNNIVPTFIQNTMQICVDAVFGAPLNFKPGYGKYRDNLAEDSGFQLVFDERIDGVESIGENLIVSGVGEDEDVFEDDGEDFDEEY